MFTLQDLMAWSGEGLEKASFDFHCAAGKYKNLNDELIDVNNSKLSGAFAESEMRTRRAIADDAMDLYSGCHKIESDLAEASKAVKELSRQANDIFNLICAAGGRLTTDGNVCDADQNYKVNVDHIYKSGRNLWEGISDANQKLNAMVALCIRKAKDIVNFIDGVYNEIIQLNKKAKGAKASVLNWNQKPNPSWDVEEVNDWWTSRSPQEQIDIIKNKSDWIRNLDGIPCSDRHKANIMYLRNKYISINNEMSFIMRKNRPPFTLNEEKRLTELSDMKQPLDILQKNFSIPISDEEINTLLNQKSFNYSLIGFRDSPKANLRAIVGVGDVDNANHVMVHTPGMNSTVDKNIFGKNGNWGGGIRDMNNILQLTRMILSKSDRKDQSVAGIYNLNYDAPDWDDTLFNTDGSVLSNEHAKDGAKKLSRLCDAVQTTHNGDPHMIVTGHSYGSLLSAYALNRTTAPDGYTAFGPPGFGKGGNSNLNMLPGHVFVGGARGDPVAGSAWHNTPPSAIPDHNVDYEHFSTEKWKSPSGEVYAGSYGHSEYMNKTDDGHYRTSAYNIASILAGNGMAAPEN